MKKRGKTAAISIAALGILLILASLFAFRREILDPARRPHTLQRERGFLGIYAGNRSGAVSVRQVFPGGPAARAGIQYDDCIIEVNGVKIGALQDFIREIQSCYRGQTIPIVVHRGGETLRLPVTLAGYSEVVTEN